MSIPHSPYAERNREEVWSWLSVGLPSRGVVLEIGSGTGQHAAAFGPRLAGSVAWQPSDVDERVLETIAERCRSLDRVLDPLRIDTCAPRESWGVCSADAVVAINVVHITPWRAVVALLCGAACLLPAGGGLFLYGAFRRDGVPTAESNALFDARLRALDPAFGIRRLERLAAVGARCGLGLDRIDELPNNNLGVTFRRDASPLPGWLSGAARLGCRRDDLRSGLS